MKPGFKLLMKEGAGGSSLLWLEDRAGEAEPVLRKEHVPALNFAEHPDKQLVDTTGAGDTFTAAFAVKFASCLSRGKNVSEDSLIECMEFATQAAFLCITRFGATEAIPRLNEVEQLADGVKL